MFFPNKHSRKYCGIFWNHPDYKNRISKRTDEMIQQGVIDEMNAISNPSKTVLQAIGMNLSNDPF
ncbi:MAG: hypothetical protein Ct9H90mP17_4820 [Actinomycetota bacterium]|nr:MAG: hypothetical protein Ct9H90mP17_4820 [Actinomycetota bacterium]